MRRVANFKVSCGTAALPFPAFISPALNEAGQLLSTGISPLAELFTSAPTVEGIDLLEQSGLSKASLAYVEHEASERIELTLGYRCLDEALNSSLSVFGVLLE
jgi:hypothetical protein